MIPRRRRLLLVAAELVVGVGALYGGVALLADPDGLGADPAWLDGSVFPDYRVPGVVLLVVVGGGMLTAAAITLLAPAVAPRAARAMALILLAWGAAETVTIGWQGPAQLVMLAAFVVVPAAILLTAGDRCRGPR